MKNLPRRTRRPLAKLCLLLTAIFSAAACGDDAFTEYTHDSGRFSVILPGTDTPEGRTLPDGTKTMQVSWKGGLPRGMERLSRDVGARVH